MKRKAFLAGLAAMSLMAGGASAQIKFSEFDLPNGLHVILHEDHSTPIVAVSVMYHVGSKNEDPNRTGFAHFFEHLLFEGSENIKRGEYMKLVQAAGGQLNANTTQDRTFYYEELPSNQLELALWMESERMLHAKIDSIGVETQRKVVKEEKKQRYDNTPYGQLMNVVYENAFTKSNYRWTPIGKEQYIDQATLPEFMDFYKTFYVPNNAVLVIGGDINTPEVIKMVTKYFGGIPKGTRPIPRDLPQEPQSMAEKRVTFYDNIQLPAVVIAYHTPKPNTPDYYALDLLTNLLSQGKSSRLQKEVVDKEQKAVQVGAGATGNEDPSIMIMFGIANIGVSPDTLEKAMLAEVEKVQKNGVTDAEMKKLMVQTETQFAEQNRKVLGVVTNLATDYTYFKDANLVNTELAKYQAVTKEDIQRVARKFFRKENRLVVYYLPKSEKKD
ncbi:MAG: insulinase family protein [Bacteroidetes bacterium]|nr:insulinase family protein [Bacteroidota bacterium]MBS1629607.1 insulinase family protein [Bacteroidota bacterium]